MAWHDHSMARVMRARCTDWPIGGVPGLSYPVCRTMQSCTWSHARHLLPSRELLMIQPLLLSTGRCAASSWPHLFTGSPALSSLPDRKVRSRAQHACTGTFILQLHHVVGSRRPHHDSGTDTMQSTLLHWPHKPICCVRVHTEPAAEAAVPRSTEVGSKGHRHVPHCLRKAQGSEAELRMLHGS